MRRVTTWLLSMPLPLLAAPAMAQQVDPTPATPPADATSAATGQDVVVTAQRRAERAIDIPLAIAVLDAEDISARGIEDVQDLSFNVPGLTMRQDGPGSYTIFLRGLANQQGSGALVGQYLDEVPLSLGGYDQLSPAPLDIARIEVLKGPQGTLYGAGSAGGTIRYITNDPDPKGFATNVESDLYTVDGGDLGARLSGFVNVPLTDTLAVRVAGALEGGGGWIDQPEAGIRNGNGTELLNLRAKVLWTPTDRLRLKGMVQIHRADTFLGLGYEEADRTVDVAIDPARVLIPKQFDFNIYNFEGNYDFGFAELMSSTTFIEHDHQYPFSYIPRPGNFGFDLYEGTDDRFLTARQFSQEFRLTNAAGPFKWTLGAFYANGRRNFVANFETLLPGPSGSIAVGDGTVFPAFYQSITSTKNFSVFADLSYDISSRFTAGVGLRYFNDRQTGLVTYVPDAGTQLREKFDSIDPRVYLRYAVNDRNNVYASFGKGFRSGGFNPEGIPPYEPENIYTYELGAKGSTADRVLSYDVAAFYTIYDNQVRRRLALINGVLLGQLDNVGKAEVKGVEAGVELRPLAGLTIGGNIAYLDSVITETDETDTVNLPGDRVDYTPSLAFTVSGNYAFDWGAGTPGFVRLDYSHRDRVSYIDRSSFRPDALPQFSDALDLVNARIGATIAGTQVELYTLNLLNQNKAIDPYQGWANSNRTRPRVFGLRTSFSF